MIFIDGISSSVVITTIIHSARKRKRSGVFCRFHVDGAMVKPNTFTIAYKFRIVVVIVVHIVLSVNKHSRFVVIHSVLQKML